MSDEVKNELGHFLFDEQEVRVLGTKDKPLFVAKDVCDVLGISKYRDALQRLDEHERELIVVDTLGGAQKMAAVTESGIYHLIFKSRKAVAKNFRRWVTEEVLPQVRKTGAFIPDDAEVLYSVPEWRALMKMDSLDLAGAFSECLRRACSRLRYVEPSKGQVVQGYIRYPKVVMQEATALLLSTVSRTRLEQRGGLV